MRNQAKLLGVAVFLVFTAALFVFFPESKKSLGAYQEYHKLIIGISSIFIAFSPSFYVYIYSNDKIKDIIIKLSIKDGLDYSFRLSIFCAGILIGLSVLGVVFSHLSKSPSEISTEINLINRFLLALSGGFFATGFYWTYYYGRLAYEIIVNLSSINTKSP